MNNEQVNLAKSGKRSINHAFSVIDSQWPDLKYLSLGFYSAWILLTMSGSGISDAPAFPNTTDVNILLYLYSGVPLSLVLIFCGIFHKKTEPYIARGPLVPIMSVIAAVCTFFVEGGLGFMHSEFLFGLTSAGTGLSTAFLCIRLGYMYSTLDSKRVLFTTFAAGILADFIYFTCSAIDNRISIAFLSLLPMLAMGLALLRPEADAKREKPHKIPASMLPRGFFGRCILFVGVFSLTVGITKGLSTLIVPAAVLKSASSTSIFTSMVILGAICAIFAILSSLKRFDMSKLYYPAIIVTALGTLLAPVLGQSFLWLQVIIVNAAYNVFVLTLWCVFSNIAGQTDMSPIRVFGLGRGASAVGTTLGQVVAVVMVNIIPDLITYLSAICVVFATLILMLAIFVLDERTIGDALDKTFHVEEESKPLPSISQEEAWNLTIDKVAEAHGLTSREREVLSLLGHGRTAAYIAEEFGISYNTTKGHVRNLYAKCDVHSRQELLDLIEKQMA